MNTWTKLKCLIPGRRKAIEQDMQDELESLALLAGAEGRRNSLGSLTLVAEQSRAAWTWVWLEQLAADTKYALRMMRKSPLFTATAVLSLALGIGANTAIFSFLNAVMLKSLPVEDPDSLVVLTSYARDGKIGDFGYEDYRALCQDNSAFKGIMAASRVAAVSAGSGSDAQTVQRKIVSGNYFSVLGVRLPLGRFIREGEDDVQAAVISHGWWQRGFGGTAGVVGRSLELDGRAFEIVGIAPPEFLSETAGEQVDVWTTVALMPAGLKRAPGFTWLYLMGRLKPNVNYQQASASLLPRMPQMLNKFIERVQIEPGRSGGAGLRNTFASPLKVLMAIVGVALLMACANLAGLLLARSASRKREIGTRLAIGASRGRLIRQLVTESLLLAILGGLAGIVFAYYGQSVLLALVTGLGRRISLDLRPDASVLVFTLLVSLATGVLVGIVPAVGTVRGTDDALKLGAYDAAGRRRKRFGVRGALIAFQISMSMLLLVVGGLFIRTMQNLQSQDMGVRTSNVLSLRIEGRRGERVDWSNVIPEIARRLDSVRGVQAAGGSLFATLANAGGITGFRVDGYAAPTGEEQRAGANWITPGYLEAAGIPLLAGRDFSLQDNASARKAAIINQSMAKHYFSASQGAVGRSFVLNDQRYEIIGVAKDAKYSDLRESARRFVYLPALQTNQEIRSLEIRTSGAPEEFTPNVRQILKQVEPRLRIVEAMTLEQRVRQKLAREVLIANLASFFGGLTLVLVILGAYGMLSYTVVRRTKEFGIRIALGGRFASVTGTVLRDLSIAVLVGLMCGLAFAVMAGRVISSMLFGVRSVDPATIAIAVAILLVAVIAASVLPVLRAARVDPVSALRLE